jgi:hypothetical protein
MFADPFGFLPKPYTPDDLTTALGNMLGDQRGGAVGASGKAAGNAGKKDGRDAG